MARSIRASHRRSEILAAGFGADEIARLRALGFSVRPSGRAAGIDIAVLSPPAGLSEARALAEARAALRSGAADLNHYYHTDADVPDCGGQGCAPTQLIGWQESAASSCGSLPVIGMVDTGVDESRPDLAGRVRTLPVARSGTAPPSDEHGTAIAAMLGGAKGGLLAGAPLLSVNAFERAAGERDRASVLSLALGIEALVAGGAKVINLSLSGPPNAVLERFIRDAIDRDVVIVAAAGNGGPGAEPAYPAAYPDVIAVTAVDAGLAVYRRAQRGGYVDMAAPGVEVTIPGLDGEHRSGTSYAVPFVTAAAAFLRAANPKTPAREIAARLARSARDLGDAGRDDTFGWGLVQYGGLCSGDDHAAPQLAGELRPGAAIPPSAE